MPIREDGTFESMKLPLTQLPFDLVVGIYKAGGRDDAMPDRLRWLAPDVAKSYANITHVVVVSDMLRSAESSLQAIREKRGAQPPGFSGHNYGLSIDIDISASRKRLGALIGAPKGLATKAQLDNWMNDCGWFCHRIDHQVAFEAWHFNALGIGTVISPKVKTTAGYIEAEIKKRFESNWTDVSNVELQHMLAELKLYKGEIDGLIGPRSKEAIRAFQRTWGLKETGVADPKTIRTMVFVTADRVIVPWE